MTLFRSKLAKVEDFVTTKADDRKPDQLAAAQAELDGLNANLILVPKTDKIKTAADLQAHIDSLTTQANEATSALEAAKKATEQVKADMEKLKTTRVLGSAEQTSDKKEGGDRMGQWTDTEKSAAVVNDPTAPWNAAADAIGLAAAPAPKEEKSNTNNDDK